MLRTISDCLKYVEAHMEIRYATNNGAYKSGRRISAPSGGVNHSVGCAQPSAEVFYKLMNDPDAGWGVNAILGDFHKGEGRIIVTLPLDARPWGCGKGKNGSWNNSHIQWEVCEPAGHTYSGGTMIAYDTKKNQTYFDRMWKMLVAWNVYMVIKHGYPVSGIADHAESHEAGYGSNHCDMGQWLPKHGKSMDKLRAEVQAIIDYVEPAPEPTPDPVPDTTNNPTDSNEEEEEMTQEQFEQMFATMIGKLQDNDHSKFSEQARAWATHNGLLVGNGSNIDGQPNMMWQAPMTREQLVTVLFRFAQLMGKA